MLREVSTAQRLPLMVVTHQIDDAVELAAQVLLEAFARWGMGAIEKFILFTQPG